MTLMFARLGYPSLLTIRPELQLWARYLHQLPGYARTRAVANMDHQNALDRFP